MSVIHLSWSGKSNIDRRKKPRLGDTKYRSKTKANKATLSSNKKGKGKL